MIEELSRTGDAVRLLGRRYVIELEHVRHVGEQAPSHQVDNLSVPFARPMPSGFISEPE